MKKIFSLVTLLAALAMSGLLQAQEQVFVRMDASTNGSLTQMDGGMVIVRDDDSQGPGAPEGGSYMAGIDHVVTLQGGCGDSARIYFIVTELAVSCIDTVFVYNGPDTNGALIVKFNSFTGNVHQGQTIFEAPSNNTDKITIRFKTDPRTDSDRTGLSCAKINGAPAAGFELAVACKKPCEFMYPHIDSAFYRTRNGVVYDTAYLREVVIPDTNWVDEEDHSLGFNTIDTISFICAHLCVGDGVIFKAHCDYTFDYGYYTPSDATSFFTWDMGFEGDSIVGVGMNRVSYDAYQKTGCYDVALKVVDAFGCSSDIYTSVRVRTSINPIKTIFTLSDICNNESLMVNMGYSGENATLTLRDVESNLSVSKVNEVRTFIPDGCSCGNPSYYEAPVEFTEFPNNKRVTSAADICSICINMEHSYVGDFFLSLVCPTGQEAVLKFGSRMISSCTYPEDYPSGNPSEPGAATGGGTFLGFPLDQWSGGRFASGSPDNEPKCDSAQNPFGVGLDYCFSRDNHYTLVTGDPAGSVWTPANPHPTGAFYISDGSNFVDNLPVTFSAVPAGFIHANETPTYTSATMPTKRPSDHDGMTDYYLPYTDFSELVGCPLNGTWKVRVYDTFGQDNGWIFNWTLDICGVTQDDDCKYTVGIDSLIWRPDPSPQYHDYDLGRYRGLVVEQATPSVSYISSPDTAGFFPINVFVYDDFGCVWDTNTRITTYWAPEPKLGPDTSLCGVDRAILDASDRHTASEDYTYTWSPFGQNTPTIETQEEASGDIDYVASVINHCGPDHRMQCKGRDTIRVSVRKQPLPNFTPEPFSFEGCDPMTITFNNQSIDADRHLWVFGDGVTSELASPTHTYAEGIYTLKYYAISDDGCIDSIVSDGGIAVYPKPNASFVWNPVYPSVLNPVVNFTNTTTPHTSNTQYYWQIQYDRDNPLSFETLTTRNATFDFSRYNENVSGNYNMRLIARTRNLAPSGNVILCSDTAANNILVINDFLQFPNVVTPNGDGVNDRFVIQNLVDGLGYPINSLDIYNQWGARVFHRENIDSDDDFWDPADLPDGTYFYRFSARGYNGNIEHNGSIEVIH